MKEKNTVREGYDGLADTYAEERSADALETEVVERVLDSLPGDARVLDAGCGQGRPVLVRTGGSISGVGLDFSREQLSRAAENAPATSLAQGDMTALPFEEATFDAVTACHSLIHVPADQKAAAVSEFARVLRPGGRLFLTSGTAAWSGSNPDWLGSGVEMRWSIAGSETTREYLEVAGFSVVEDGIVENGLADDEDAVFSYFVAQLAD